MVMPHFASFVCLHTVFKYIASHLFVFDKAQVTPVF